jgi:hypothetical protein
MFSSENLTLGSILGSLNIFKPTREASYACHSAALQADPRLATNPISYPNNRCPYERPIDSLQPACGDVPMAAHPAQMPVTASAMHSTNASGAMLAVGMPSSYKHAGHLEEGQHSIYAFLYADTFSSCACMSCRTTHEKCTKEIQELEQNSAARERKRSRSTESE